MYRRRCPDLVECIAIMAPVKPHRINILGGSGCGASTTGQALAEALVVPYFDSDDYYHEPSNPPFQKQRSAQDRHRRITSDLSRSKSWVLGGGVAGWEPYPELDFTLIVFLWLPWSIREARLRTREFRRYGNRIAPGGDMHQMHEAFIQWSSRYDIGDVDGKTHERHQAYLAGQACPIIAFQEEQTCSSLVGAILNAVGTSAHRPMTPKDRP